MHEQTHTTFFFSSTLAKEIARAPTYRKVHCFYEYISKFFLSFIGFFKKSFRKCSLSLPVRVSCTIFLLQFKSYLAGEKNPSFWSRPCPRLPLRPNCSGAMSSSPTSSRCPFTVHSAMLYSLEPSFLPLRAGRVPAIGWDASEWGVTAAPYVTVPVAAKVLRSTFLRNAIASVSNLLPPPQNGHSGGGERRDGAYDPHCSIARCMFATPKIGEGGKYHFDAVGIYFADNTRALE